MSNPQLVTRIHDLLSIAAGTSGATTTDALKQATNELQSLYKGNVVIPSLLELALTAPETEIRQLAAVECRKRVDTATASRKPTSWLRVTPSTRTHIKSRLLSHLDTNMESVPRVQHAIARIVASIAQIELPHGTWPEILPWLWNSASSADVGKRKNGVFCLSSVLDAFVDQANEAAFSSYSSQLFPLLERTISDPESLEVRLSTVKAIGTMTEYIDQSASMDIAHLQRLVPHVMEVLDTCVRVESEEGVTTCIDVLETMAFSEVPLINDHIAALCHFALTTAHNEQIDEDLRSNILNLVAFIVRYKKTRIHALNLSNQLLEGLLPVAALDDPADVDTDSPSRAAIRIIEVLANALPPAHVVDPLIGLCQQYSVMPDPRCRKAAIAAFGSIFEGCSIYLQPHLSDLWPFVEKSLADEDDRVRKAACVSLACMCEALGSDCASRHAQLLPLIVNLVRHPDSQRAALNALDELLEYLGKDTITIYLASLMDNLLYLLPNVGKAEQAAVVGCIGSAAHAAKDGFLPFFSASMAAFMPLLSLTAENGGENAEMLRGTVQDTVGTLAEAVGREAFEPYFRPTMDAAHHAATVESATLRECAYIFFAVIARVYKDDFGAFLPTVVPMLIASVIREDVATDLVGAVANGHHSGLAPAPENDEEEDAGFIDDGESIESIDIEAQSALAVEKEVACDALGELFVHTGVAFIPYLPVAVEHLLTSMDHYYEGLRKSAVSALLSFISTGNALADPIKWSPSMNPVPMNGQVQHLADSIMPRIIKLYEKDDEREVIQSVCDDISGAALKVGPALIMPYLESICKTTLSIIQRKAPCQSEEDEAAGSGTELAEWDGALIRSAADLVSTLAMVCGPAFASGFSQFLPALAAYYDAKSASSERSGVIGALAECCNGLAEGVGTFAATLVHLFAQALVDPDLDVRSNAAYAAGSLVLHSTTDLSDHFADILNSVSPLLIPASSADENSLDAKHASDNACGCIARLILKDLMAVPLSQVLPIYLGALPIKDDFRENARVHESLCLLLRSQEAAVAPHVDRILSVFHQTLQAQRVAKNEDSQPLTAETLQLVSDTLRATVPQDRVQPILSLV